uniref:GTP-binding protein 1 n=1 Tax=Sinocyclocheilus rhinocerous TaxID=307959 RepID=A0A673NG69_9TELE
MIYKNCIFLFKIISFLRVAVVGNVDAGKSTLLGVLTHGELDNGRGFARQKLFRHKHEMESGRTSSVGNDILGFDQEGHVVNKPDINGTSVPEGLINFKFVF